MDPVPSHGPWVRGWDLAVFGFDDVRHRFERVRNRRLHFHGHSISSGAPRGGERRTGWLHGWKRTTTTPFGMSLASVSSHSKSCQTSLTATAGRKTRLWRQEMSVAR